MRALSILFLSFVLSHFFGFAIVLEEEVRHDLELIIGAVEPIRSATDSILDVAIIGAGQSGMTLCLALHKQGVFNVAIFDSAPTHLEGPWVTTARMPVLRSKKESLIGLALGIPHLTFRAWYEAKYGNWEELGKVSRFLWAEYLKWYKEVLHLTINNEHTLLSIIPEEGGLLRLLFQNGKEVRSRKVVLATGRSGGGGFEIPSFMKDLPKSYYFHTGEAIDPESFRGKRICVVGAGASAFDAAATALESGAEKVDMLMRKSALPKVNLVPCLSCWRAYYSLDDKRRIDFFQKILEVGTPPPVGSVQRTKKWKNFHLHPSTAIESISVDQQISIHTNQGVLETDLIILGTGYAGFVANIAEVSAFEDQILTWNDRHKELSPRLGHFPYLGGHFEFLEKHPGEAPYLKDIYCFNYGAYLSHGLISGDIDLLSIGSERLAEGLTIALFLESYQ